MFSFFYFYFVFYFKHCTFTLWQELYKNAIANFDIKYIFSEIRRLKLHFEKTYFLLKGLFTIFKIFTQICIINIKQKHYARFKVTKKTAKFSTKLLWTWHRIWTVLCVTWNKWTILLNILFLTLSIYLFLIFLWNKLFDTCI